MLEINVIISFINFNSLFCLFQAMQESDGKDKLNSHKIKKLEQNLTDKIKKLEQNLTDVRFFVIN